MEGIRELGPEFADPQAFETFQAEARALLFKDDAAAGGEPGGRDPVDLRLSIAREDALAFKAQAERAIAAELEKSRFPTACRADRCSLEPYQGRGGSVARSPLSARRCGGDRAKPGAGRDLEGAKGRSGGVAPDARGHAGAVRHGLRARGRTCAPRRPRFEAPLRVRDRSAGASVHAMPSCSREPPIFRKKASSSSHGLNWSGEPSNSVQPPETCSDWARQKLVVGIAHLIAGPASSAGQTHPSGT